VETIDLGDKTLLQDKAGQVFECRSVIGSSIAKADCAGVYPAELYCGPKFSGALIQEFEVCAKELALACRAFGKIIRPICPFDPIYVFDKIQLAAKLEVLQQRVEELEARGAK
jgi:hypothetical protein